MSLNNSHQISEVKFLIAKGIDGANIESIEKTGTDGLVDTYTVTYTNGFKTTFTVTNGTNGSNANLADVAPNTTAQKDYAVNEHIILDEVYYIVTQPIAEGETIEVGVNIEERKVGDEISFIANIKYEDGIIYLPRTGCEYNDGIISLNMFN